jgi:hypothetical protein
MDNEFVAVPTKCPSVKLPETFSQCNPDPWAYSRAQYIKLLMGKKQLVENAPVLKPTFSRRPWRAPFFNNPEHPKK